MALKKKKIHSRIHFKFVSLYTYRVTTLHELRLKWELVAYGSGKGSGSDYCTLCRPQLYSTGVNGTQ